ncbi:O-antigen ligase family protein [Melghirimyces algeriensis]|uniref:O-antigen ligase n=1 Tax=Melghirimyces algeriensis TaxID=910412 RepID=A0A521DYQ6_9BACL|nr:O-antigen ligase family protein [Melghirimyces algeriensis]SMO76864.1 O-antigen ligase [Melghirimyces algeriensis]
MGTDSRKDKINKRWMQLLYIMILLSPIFPVVVLLLIGVGVLLFHRGKWHVFGWPERIFLGFVFWSLISWFFNPYLLFGWLPVGFVPIFFFGLYYLLSVWVKEILRWDWREFQNLYLMFWFFGLYVAIVTIFQRVDWIPTEKSTLFYLLGFYPMQQAESVRSIGTASNSNLAAAMLICLSLLSIYASSVLKTRLMKSGALLSFVVFCGAIWCTGSRGAWVGLVIGLLIQVWMTGNRTRAVLLFLGLVTLGMVIYTNKTLIPREETLFATAEVRIFVWQNSFQLFMENWLTGVLPLHFSYLFDQMTGKYLFHAHNILLGIAVEYGIVGLTLLLSLIVVTTHRARRWRKTANTKEEKRLAGSLISIVFALLGHGMYDYPIIAPQIGLIFMLAVIIIHQQYEKRCLHRPDWCSDRKKSEY